MPHPSSPTAPSQPSPLLALLAASVVKSFDPAWLSRPVSELAGDVGIRADRVSRLKKKLLGSLEKLLSRASTRGRKKRRKPSKKELRLLRLQALLDVSREVLRLGGVKKRRAQDFLVAARDRLKREQEISSADFCRALGLSERTVRYWAKRGVAMPKQEEVPEPPPEPGDRRIGRFDLAVTLPGLQAMGDTTSLSLFGVPLKVVALQDPGARHERPWEDFAVDTEENHQVVIDVVTAALEGKRGTQVIFDQGTPYMAAATKDALEELGLFHEPQKEGAPTEKATLERSFGIVKRCLAPLFGLTDKLAALLPALKDEALAKAVGRLFLAAYLHVYVTASRVRETGRTDDPQVLEAIAEAQREKAVAEHRSAKLLLEAIFDRHGFEGSKRDFVRAHRYHFIEDIEEAERRLARQATRSRILHWERYFAGILHNVREGRRKERERRASLKRRAVRERSEAERARRERDAHEADLKEDPARRIAEGLSVVAGQYRKATDNLFNDGVGPGTRQIREGFEAIAGRAPGALFDHAERGWRNFETGVENRRSIAAVRRVFERLLAEAKNAAPFPDDSTSAILWPGSHPNKNPRPPPDDGLRNSAAGSGET